MATQLIAPRQDDGTLPEIYYAHISASEGKSLIDAGVKIDADDSKYATTFITIPGIEYAGEAPDLGAYETDFLLKNATLPVELNSISNTDELAIHVLHAVLANQFVQMYFQSKIRQL